MPVNLATLALPASIVWDVWLPYFTGAVILVVGVMVVRKEVAQRPGLDKIVALGPMFIAIPIAVFGTEHFTSAQSLARIVPAWIPGHMFWTLLVGTCLISAALSLVVKKQDGLAAALFGVMMLCFVLLIHIPGIVGAPGNRIRWTVALREIAFSGGALALAAAQTETLRTRGAHTVITLSRLFVGIPTLFFGAEHFLHPELAPGVPLVKLTPLWIPARLLISYLKGTVFVVSGLGLIFNKKPRLAATWLGVMILALVLLVYVPVVIANPSDIGNGLNYLVDTLLLSGSALALAGAQTGKLKTQTA